MLKIPNWKDKLLVGGIFLVALAVMYVFKITCPVLKFLHIPCPGCGMTRAWISALQLDFAAAFSYHGMFWSMPILLLYYLYDGKLLPWRWADRLILIAIAIGFAVNWIIKLL